MEWITLLPWNTILEYAVAFIIGLLWKQPKIAKMMFEGCKLQKPE